MPAAPRVSDRPTPGWYLIRLVKNGPKVGAQLSYDPADGWSAMIDGEREGPSRDPWMLPMVERIHFYGLPVTESEVEYRIGVKRWAAINKPGHPAANPRRAINIDEIIPF